MLELQSTELTRDEVVIVVRNALMHQYTGPG